MTTAFGAVACQPNITGKEWMTLMSTMLDTIGLTKTADTGQVVLASASQLSSPTTWPYYEVRSWDDGYGVIFMKIEYGQDTSGWNSYQITLGTGSDGAGSITGIVMPRFKMSGGNSGNTTVATHFASRVGTAITLYSNQILLHFSIDRQRDANGVPIAGTYYFTYSANASGYCTAHRFIKPSIGRDVTLGGSAAASIFNGGHPASSLGLGTCLALSPYKMDVFPQWGVWPEISVQPGIVGVLTTDMQVANNQEFMATFFGVSRRYKVINSTAHFYPQSGAVAWAIPWE